MLGAILVRLKKAGLLHFFLNELVAPSNCFLECRINQYWSGQLNFKISNMFSINLPFLVQCAVSHHLHHGARRSSNRNSFTFFRLHCLYVLTRWRAGLCIGGTLAEFLAGHIHNWLKSMALKTPSTKRYIGEIKSINVSYYPRTYQSIEIMFLKFK